MKSNVSDPDIQREKEKSDKIFLSKGGALLPPSTSWVKIFESLGLFVITKSEIAIREEWVRTWMQFWMRCWLGEKSTC